MQKNLIYTFMKIMLFILFMFIFANCVSQTVIEMSHPDDANIILFVVDDISKADIIIYKTEDRKDTELWDCMWKFRKWGFSNFGVYLQTDSNDVNMKDEEMGLTYHTIGNVYFTTNKDERGYKNKFQLEGIMRKN